MYCVRYLIAVLLSVTSAAAAFSVLSTELVAAISETSKELYDYPETALSGIVSAEVSKPLGDCRELCTSRSGCAGYDHSWIGGSCRLFAAIDGARQSDIRTAGTRNLLTGYRPPSNPPSTDVQPQSPQEDIAVVRPAPATFNRYLNRDLTGGADETYDANDIMQCEAMCRASDGWCTAFTFDKWNGKCFLKQRAGELLMNARATSGVLSALGAPYPSSSPVYFEYFNNKAFPGSGYRSLTVRNREECESECWSQSACMAFAFTSSQRLCVLHDQPSEYSSSRGTFSGAKRQQ